MKRLIAVTIAALLLLSSGVEWHHHAEAAYAVITVEVGETTYLPSAASLAYERIVGIPFLDQKAYPTGCESVTAVMALQYAGYEISVDTFIDDYLPCGDRPQLVDGVRYGCDPYEAFPGDPRTIAGYGCFAPVIAGAAERVVDDRHRVQELHGSSLTTLCEQYIDRGIPVMVWATAGMKPSRPSVRWFTDTGRVVQWVAPMHCLLLVGYTKNEYLFHDPQVGAYTAYDRAACETAYAVYGQQAVVILPAS